jgi:RNA polymerase sigma-70 factor (ECF subfamily)
LRLGKKKGDPSFRWDDEGGFRWGDDGVGAKLAEPFGACQTLAMNDAPRATRQRGRLADDLMKVAGGDRSAFAEVYRSTSGKLFGICLRILDNRSEAEEALQEAYVNVWRKAEAFDPARSSPITWLAALARNKAIDRLRARGSRPAEALGVEALALPDPAASAPERIEASEERRQLSRCIDELETNQARAIRTAFFRGATYAELAEQERVPLGTLKSWIRRGLLRLRECLER